ncbi:leucine-rich repeats and immunoglobulin-like domains protein 3 [Tachysurus ichikawai]
MSALVQQQLWAVKPVVLVLLLTAAQLIHGNKDRSQPCPSLCTCTDTLMDCRRFIKGSKLHTMPSWVTQV